jgi:hypothetical protein
MSGSTKRLPSVSGFRYGAQRTFLNDGKPIAGCTATGS